MTLVYFFDRLFTKELVHVLRHLAEFICKPPLQEKISLIWKGYGTYGDLHATSMFISCADNFLQ